MFTRIIPLPSFQLKYVYVFSHTCFDMMGFFVCLFVWVFQCFLWGVWEGGVPFSKKVFFIISKGSTLKNERVEVSHSPLKQCLRYLYIKSSSSLFTNFFSQESVIPCFAFYMYIYSPGL